MEVTAMFSVGTHNKDKTLISYTCSTAMAVHLLSV